jgi:sugar phosphate isomerase/epimerase
MYKLGFVSAIFGDRDFEYCIDFASENGFDCVELMCWPRGKADRRYAGVTHIDVDDLNEDQVRPIREYLDRKRVFISGLGYYPNPLDPDAGKREFYFSHLRKVIRAASLLGVPVVNTFAGRDQYQSIDANLALFERYWPPLIRYAESLQIKIGIENCPMAFTIDEWPGGKNLAISPAVWDRLFAIAKSPSFGLNFDPSHFVWQQMDYLKPLAEYQDKLFHIHLKDAKILKEKLDRVGIFATPLEFHSPKLPGLGDIDWAGFFSTLKKTKYEGPVVIEFEDKEFEGSEDTIRRGLLEAKKHVSQYI